MGATARQSVLENDTLAADGKDLTFHLPREVASHRIRSSSFGQLSGLQILLTIFTAVLFWTLLVQKCGINVEKTAGFPPLIRRGIRPRRLSFTATVLRDPTRLWNSWYVSKDTFPTHAFGLHRFSAEFLRRCFGVSASERRLSERVTEGGDAIGRGRQARGTGEDTELAKGFCQEVLGGQKSLQLHFNVERENSQSGEGEFSGPQESAIRNQLSLQSGHELFPSSGGFIRGSEGVRDISVDQLLDPNVAPSILTGDSSDREMALFEYFQSAESLEPAASDSASLMQETGGSKKEAHESQSCVSLVQAEHTQLDASRDSVLSTNRYCEALSNTPSLPSAAEMALVYKHSAPWDNADNLPGTIRSSGRSRHHVDILRSILSHKILSVSDCKEALALGLNVLAETPVVETPATLQRLSNRAFATTLGFLVIRLDTMLWLTSLFNEFTRPSAWWPKLIEKLGVQHAMECETRRTQHSKMLELCKRALGAMAKQQRLPPADMAWVTFYYDKNLSPTSPFFTQRRTREAVPPLASSGAHGSTVK